MPPPLSQPITPVTPPEFPNRSTSPVTGLVPIRSPPPAENTDPIPVPPPTAFSNGVGTLIRSRHGNRVVKRRRLPAHRIRPSSHAQLPGRGESFRRSSWL